MGDILTRSPEQILDDNKVRIAGSMRNRILSAMNDYANQERNKIKVEIKHNAQYWTNYLINKGIVQEKDRQEVELAFLHYMEWLRDQNKSIHYDLFHITAERDQQKIEIERLKKYINDLHKSISKI